MAPKTKSGIHWTNLELKGLLEDEDSCVYLERAKKHLGLHPIHLNDLNGSLREMLSEKLNFYDTELNGLILAYRNPKILSPYGETLYDTCYIHIDIEADFYVFRPEIGRSLKGYANKQSTNHIGILVHKAYNVSIPRPDGDELSEDDWPGHHVRVGQEIRFTPEEINFKSRLPYIRGSLHQEEYLKGCQLFNEQIAANYEWEFQETTRRSFSQSNPNKTIVKTENKRIVFNSDSEVEIDPDSGSERKSSIKKLNVSSDGTYDSVDTLSKKKKRKSTPARELGPDYETEKLDREDSTDRPKKHKHNANMSPSETEDERVQKSKIKKISQADLPDHSSETESTIDLHKKKHKKKSKNYLDFDTEDERNHKAEIKNIANNLSQGSTGSDESVSKKLKKREIKPENGEESTENLTDQPTHAMDDAFVTKRQKKKKTRVTRDTECVDTEDELRYKSTIDKSLTPVAADEPVTTKSKKKRKRSFLDEVPEDTEDERKYKSSLKEYIETNNLVPEEPPKKRKKKHSYSEVCENTEDEKRYKKSLNDSEFRVPETPKKKRKKVIVTDDTLMDTEDEKQHKSYLKDLVEAMESNDPEVSTERVESKKEKKTRNNSVDYVELMNGNIDEMNGLSDVVVKSEDEQEAKKKLKRKEKHRREETQ